jgi:CHAT domain-containing protein
MAQLLTYRDLTLEFTDWKEDGSYKVRVIGAAPDGQTMRADQAETARYRVEEFRRPLAKLMNRTATKSELMDLGSALADLMLPGRARAIFLASLNLLESKGEALRLRLSIEALELSALPWEYAFMQRAPGEKVPSDFLALRPNISLTRYENIGTALQPLAPKSEFRIVAALASPMDENLEALKVDLDAQAIGEAVAALQKTMPALQPVILNPATRAELSRALHNVDIFHFAGHGLFDGAELMPDGRLRKQGRILLVANSNKPDPFASDQLAVMVSNAGVRLVVLGACNTAARDEGGAWTGVAPALVRNNIPAVVAMQFRVADAAAPVFLGALYLHVLQGKAIDQAVSEGRVAVFTRALDWAVERDWGVPVLYLQAPDGILFPSAALTAAQPRSSPPDSGPPINKRELRIALVKHFNPTSLEELCADIQQDISDAGNPELIVNLAMVGGSNMVSYALNLIEYLEHRGYLAYLVAAVRRARPGVI